MDRYWIRKTDAAGLVSRFGSPLFVFSEKILRKNFWIYREAFPQAEVAYALKANPLLAILRFFNEEGALAEVASLGEIHLARQAGWEGGEMIFNGNAKTVQELESALDLGVRINIDSAGELRRIKDLTRGKKAPFYLGIRTNPGICAGGHEFLQTATGSSKFGIPLEEVEDLLRKENIRIEGLHFHIGSQITSIEPFRQALSLVLQLWDRLAKAGHPLKYLDIGGGLGVDYEGTRSFPRPRDLAEGLSDFLRGRDLRVLLEPGRSLVADAGVLLTTVEYIKEIRGMCWAFLDAGADLLLRAAYLGWHHEIILLDREAESRPTCRHSLGGPLCFAGDIIARDRELPRLREGDLLAVLHAGAYTSSMMNNYCGRLNPAMVMIRSEGVQLVRRRQQAQDLLCYDIQDGVGDHPQDR